MSTPRRGNQAESERPNDGGTHEGLGLRTRNTLKNRRRSKLENLTSDGDNTPPRTPLNQMSTLPNNVQMIPTTRIKSKGKVDKQVGSNTPTITSNSNGKTTGTENETDNGGTLEIGAEKRGTNKGRSKLTLGAHKRKERRNNLSKRHRKSDSDQGEV